MKLFSRLIAAVLAVTVLFAMIPAEVTRADTTTLDITVDPELIRSLFAEDELQTDLRSRFNGRVTINSVDPGAPEMAVFERFDVQSDRWSSGLYFCFPLEDGSYLNLYGNLHVTVNGATLNYLGWGGACSEFSDMISDRSCPDYAAIGTLVTLSAEEGEYYLGISMMTTHHQGEMYRLYNPNSGEHFYTGNPLERLNLINLGWNDEGVGWRAPVSSNTPVYRLYNQYGGEHHYTTSMAERDSLIAAGWDYEDIGWYSDDARTVPLYRQYNPNEFANNHNYTASREENDYLVSLGWRAEDIGWYGVS